MKKQLLLSTLLVAGMMTISAQGVFAATTASQTLVGTLGFSRSIVTNGGNAASAITDVGDISTAFTPGFTIKCNSASSQTLNFNGTVTASDGTPQAFFDVGGAPYIVLANQTVQPNVAAVADAKAATPVEANNPNVIAYPVNALPSTPNVLKLAWAAFATDKWVGTLTNKGNINTVLTVPAGAARPLTFSGDDEAGGYQATVTLSYV